MSKRTKTKEHNISGKEYLSIAEHDPVVLQALWDKHLTERQSKNQHSSYLAELPINTMFITEKGGRKVQACSLIWDGKLCLLKWTKGIVASKQKLNMDGKQEVKLHQIAAVLRFGQKRIQQLRTVPSAEDNVISHTCGVEYCGEATHLVLEPKWINDERQNCHFIMNSILARGQERAKLKAFGTEYCPHYPRCGEENSLDNDMSWDVGFRDKSLCPARDEFIKILPTWSSSSFCANVVT
jgi:hypothetical protein